MTIKKINTQSAVVTFLIIGIVLFFYFGYDLSEVQAIVILTTGVLAYLYKRTIVGFLNPPHWLFNIRIVLYFALYGLFAGVYFLLSDQFSELNINSEAMKMGGIMVLMTVFINSTNRIVFNRLHGTRRFMSLEREVASGLATWILPGNKRHKGHLLLTGKKLSFTSSKSIIKEFEIENDIREVSIVKSRILHIPYAFKVNDYEGIIALEFPKYWVEKIKQTL
jgi:hypothetical protein